MLNFVEKDKDITNLSNFKTPAKARYYFQINSYEDINKLWQIISVCKKESLPHVIIGWGTNVLFGFNKYNGVIIKNSLSEKIIVDPINKCVDVCSGELVVKLASLIKKIWFTSLLPWLWLPWTIGGAVYWNAWCFWLEVSDVLLSAEVFDLSAWKTIMVKKDFFEFDYRHSLLKELPNLFIIKAKFDISQEYTWDIISLLKKRKETQPSGFTCWCFFKNPEWNYAWKLLEDAGLKWFCIWWAQVSDIHANFLINSWAATYDDILNLWNLIKEKIKEKNWLLLEEEVQVIVN